MGLCKCPKKKVTNLFCFEHRVNVCEHCLVSNHPTCIVKSYLQWLQDSDYDPDCQLCKKPLANEQIGECVRLICYDVFHWNCLDSYARRMPSNTAPAGFKCPLCDACIFPAPNIASPVAEALRKSLIKVNWARAGIGLPLIEEPPSSPTHNEPQQFSSSIEEENISNRAAEVLHNKSHSGGSTVPHNSAAVHLSSHQEQLSNAQASREKLQQTFPNQSHVVSITDSTPYARGTERDFTDPRKLFDATDGGTGRSVHDHDEDKYKRRPALQWFARWFQSRSDGRKKDPNATFKRFILVLIIGVVGFMTVIVIFSKMGRLATENDPMLDPLGNPNIRVESN